MDIQEIHSSEGAMQSITEETFGTSDLKETYDAVPVPTLRPPSITEEKTAPIVDWDRLKQFREFWLTSGGNLQSFDSLLSKTSIVTPELHHKSFENIVIQIRTMLDVHPTTKMNVITSGGRSGRQMVNLFTNPPSMQSEIKQWTDKKQVNLSSLSKSAEHGTNYHKIEDENVLRDENCTFAYIDDWILGGQQFRERINPLIEMRKMLQEKNIVQSPLRFLVLVGGMTPNAFQSLQKEYGPNIDMAPLFSVPLACQLFSSEEKRNIARDIKIVTGHVQMIAKAPLTLEWERVPDNFPAIFTSLGGVYNPVTKEQEYLFQL